MGYYTGGDYYMAGGFSLKKLRRSVTKLSKFTSKVTGAAAPFATLVNPALGQGLMAVSQQSGRISQLLSPQAAPAGMPMDGSPPFAQFFTQGTFGQMDPRLLQMMAAMMGRL